MIHIGWHKRSNVLLWYINDADCSLVCSLKQERILAKWTQPSREDEDCSCTSIHFLLWEQHARSFEENQPTSQPWWSMEASPLLLLQQQELATLPITTRTTPCSRWTITTCSKKKKKTRWWIHMILTIILWTVQAAIILWWAAVIRTAVFL